MKKLLKLLCIVLCLSSGVMFYPQPFSTVEAATNQFAGGSGTEEDPYLISTAIHLNRVRNYPNAHYKMTNDIVFTSDDYSSQFYNGGGYWEPIQNFTGSFDGNNYTIDGLKMSRSWSGASVNNVVQAASFYGLFGEAEGSVSNLHVKNIDYVINVSKGYNANQKVYVGGIVGYGVMTVNNCSASGKITVTGRTEMASAEAGGIAGALVGSNSKATNCMSSVNITATCSYNYGGAELGGIVGYFTGNELSNCVNTGNLLAKAYYRPNAGGIAGTGNCAIIKNCYNRGTVEAYASLTTSGEEYNGAAFAGGIVAFINYPTVMSSCGNMGTVDAYGLGTYAGGLVANVQGAIIKIQDSFNSAAVTACDSNSRSKSFHYAAGITATSGETSRCFNTGTITCAGTDYVYAGGIAAYSFDYIMDSYNAGEVQATESAAQSMAGGIAGNCADIIENCYNVGICTGGKAGAIAGNIGQSSQVVPSITKCYYLNNMAQDVYSNSESYTVSTTKCTSTNMRKQSTFSTFDFNEIWTITGSAYLYPQFKTNEHVDTDSEEGCKITGHVLQQHAAKAPLCAELGYEAYETCYFCDYTTYKEIPALGHNFSEWVTVKEATCETSGSEVQVCLTCGGLGFETTLCDFETYPESPHDYEPSQTYEYNFSYPGAYRLRLQFSSNTETENNFDTISLYDANGTLIKTYSGTELQAQEVIVEGESFSIKLKSDGYIEKYGFSFDRIYAEMLKGDHCREVTPLGHDEEVHEAKPACEEIGWKEYVTCSRCEYSTYEEIQPTGHEMGDWSVSQEATCTEEGQNARKCNHCSYEETEAIDPINHASKYASEKTDSTCTESGYEAGEYCPDCETWLSGHEVINAKGHSFTEYVSDNNATQEADGTKTAICDNCKEATDTIPDDGSKLPTVTGWQFKDGQWYYYDALGEMVTGWVQDKGVWYYMDESGVMATGWIEYKGDWYYLKSSGAMATGWLQVGKAWYYFESSGVMVANKWVGNYYLQADGSMATNKWIGKYYVGADGAWKP